MNTSEYTLDSVGGIVASQRRFFRTGATLPVSWRIHQLKRGFREFTNPQTVLRGSRWLNLSQRTSLHRQDRAKEDVAASIVREIREKEEKNIYIVCDIKIKVVSLHRIQTAE